MTELECATIDERLAEYGWRYNPEWEQYETIPTQSAGPSRVGWEHVADLMPDVSKEEFEAYEDRKYWMAQREPAMATRDSMSSMPVGSPLR